MQPILKALLRRPLMPLLVIVQVGLACAIACNALHLLQQNLMPLLAPAGIHAPDRLILVSNVVSNGQPWPAARLHAVEARLAALPGVASASLAVTLPLGTNTEMSAHVTGAGQRTEADASIFEGDHLIRTLGLRLVAGRRFTALENDSPASDGGPVIITRALANRLFPGGRAVGRQIVYRGSSRRGQTIIGVVAHLLDYGENPGSALDYSIVEPGFHPKAFPMPAFAVRGDPDVNVGALRRRVRTAIRSELGARMMPGIQLQVGTFASIRGEAMARPRAIVWLLSSVMVIVLVVALVGIAGVTGYWVQQRTHSIGIRRALGARRCDILCEMLVENLVVVGIGVGAGLVAAYGVNLWMMRHFELTRLPWAYLPVGAALLIALGQLAAFHPALRASRVPPVAAIRAG